ncbi:formin protein [Salix suchowensis]|nr:formin protein [Salix suchowensis]
MIKAVKKLKKLWPRKKKRKRSHQYQEPYYHHPPSPCHCCCSYPAAPTQPSAPPLPPWLEPELTSEAISAPGLQSLPDMARPSQILVPSQEIVMETSPVYPTLPSYQQYLVPSPVYGVPVEQKTRREESTGFFGCVVNFCASLISCFCPCFRIQEKKKRAHFLHFHELENPH